jgi:hypothetical protein
MRIRLAGGLFALLLLAGCGGGMELGGDQLGASGEAAVGDDPLDGGAVNDGVGNVIN